MTKLGSPLNFCVFLAFALAFASACATTPRKYPPRRPGCELHVFRSELPQIAGAWEDIGIAEAGCYLDESEVACLHRLHIEACRMGGDILYAVPKRAARPMERAMVIRAKVAHTLPANANKPEPPAPPPATSTSPSEPVTPIAPSQPPSPTTPADAGTPDAAPTPKVQGE